MSEKKNQSNDIRHLYTEGYFLGSATGFDVFKHFNGKSEQLIDKFRMVIDRLSLVPSDRLLDIGCGRGEMVIYHSVTGGKATGVDFSDDAIKIAKAKAAELHADCTFLNISFEEIDEQLNFDKIISVDFIEHISAGEGKAFFKKCFRVLNPGGKLVVFTYPNTIRRKYGYKLIRLFSIVKRNPLPAREPDTISDHYKQYHLNEQNYFTLKKMATDEGFKHVEVVYFDPGVKDSIIKSILLNTPFRHLFLTGLTLIAEK